MTRANLAGRSTDRGFRLVEDDLCTMDLGGLVDGAAGVFHLAGRPGVRASWGDGFAGYARDNLVATQRVAEAAARAGVRLVWTSSSSVYGETPPGTRRPSRRPPAHLALRRHQAGLRVARRRVRRAAASTP